MTSPIDTPLTEEDLKTDTIDSLFDKISSDISDDEIDQIVTFMQSRMAVWASAERNKVASGKRSAPRSAGATRKTAKAVELLKDMPIEDIWNESD